MVRRVKVQKGGWQTPYSAGRGTLIALILLLGAALFLLLPREETTAAEGKHRFLRADLPSLSSPFSTISTPSSPGWYHKTLWSLDTRDFATLTLATCGLIIAAGEGIGGGVILVPLFILVLDLPPRRAIPLSNITILGGAIASTWHSLSQRHPQGYRPPLDWNLALMIGPTAILGAVAGAVLNKILPELVISFLLVTALAALAYRMLQKGMKILEQDGRWANLWTLTGGRRRETSAALLARTEGAINIDCNASLSSDAVTRSATPAPPRAAAAAAAAAAASVAVNGEEEERGEVKAAGGSVVGKRGVASSWIGTIEDQEVVGVSDYGTTILSTRPSSAATPRTPNPSKAKRKVLLTPVKMLQSEEEGGRAGGGEEDLWSSPFDGPSSPRRGASLSPSKAKNRVLLTPITPERERKGDRWKEAEEEEEEEQQQQWEQAEEVKEEWVSRERGDFKEDMSRAAHLPSSELDSMMGAERKIFWWKPLALSACFLGVIVADMLKGGKGSSSPLGITCGSPSYWLVMLATLPWVGAFLYKIRQLILQECEAKRQSGYSCLPGDVRWTPTNTVQGPALGATAGLVAGAVGVGDGMVEDFLLLKVGVLPTEAAAAAAILILYTSAAAAVAFYVFGLFFSLEHAALFLVWGFGCTFVGRLVVSRMVRQHDMESLILLLMGGVILLSAVIMGRKVVRDYVGDTAKAFRMSPLCE